MAMRFEELLTCSNMQAVQGGDWSKVCALFGLCLCGLGSSTRVPRCKRSGVVVLMIFAHGLESVEVRQGVSNLSQDAGSSGWGLELGMHRFGVKQNGDFKLVPRCSIPL